MKTLLLLAAAFATPQLCAQRLPYTLTLNGGTNGYTNVQPACAVSLQPAAGFYTITRTGSISESSTITGTITTTSAFFLGRNSPTNGSLVNPGTRPATICVQPGDTLYFWPDAFCTQQPILVPTGTLVVGTMVLTLQPESAVTINSSPCGGGSLPTSFLAAAKPCGWDLTIQGTSGDFYWVIASPTPGPANLIDAVGNVPLCTGSVLSLLNNQVEVGLLPRSGAVSSTLHPIPALAGVTLYAQAFTWRPVPSGPGFQAGSSDLLTIQF